MAFDLVVVGTPELIGDRDRGGLETLADLPWLQELNTREVEEWFARRRIARRPRNVVHMPGNLIQDAVRRGDGLTYTPLPFVEDDIRAGRLRAVATPDRDLGRFQIVTRPGVQRPPVKAFVRWLRRQSRRADPGG
jgi:LysR family glycine cleavage system transcriptional activator